MLGNIDWSQGVFRAGQSPGQHRREDVCPSSGEKRPADVLSKVIGRDIVDRCRETIAVNGLGDVATHGASARSYRSVKSATSQCMKLSTVAAKVSGHEFWFGEIKM